eukprot:m.189353 g.189353  ORF g.189353 m.189353 type:complete len:306 (+) comp15628_c0_seq3:353-1270(+)
MVQMAAHLFFGTSAHYSAETHMRLELVAVLGGLGFVVGSVFFYPTFGREGSTIGTWLYIIGSLIYTIDSACRASEWFMVYRFARTHQKLFYLDASPEMKHNGVSTLSEKLLEEPCNTENEQAIEENQENQENPTLQSNGDGPITYAYLKVTTTLWELILFEQPPLVRFTIATLYFVGNCMFLIGSCFIFPFFDTNKFDFGIWMYIWGCVLDFFVLIWDVSWRHVHQHTPEEKIGLMTLYRKSLITLYIMALLSFIIGSVIFFPWYAIDTWGVVLFVLGSACFMAGSLESYFIEKHLHNYLKSKDR